MNTTDLRWSRLRAQRLVDSPAAAPADVVAHLTAVQSQDLAGGLWAVGLRTDTTAADVTKLIDEGVILRTHVLRPTWHLVLPRDVGWMLQLTGARIAVGNDTRLRQLGVTRADVDRCLALMLAVLAGGNHLTRTELGHHLAANGSPIDSAQLMHITLTGELERLIVSGATRGRQTTYALMSERAPQPPRFDRDAAVVELLRRYMTSHGPATLADFAWWSGLTLGDGRRAAVDAGLVEVRVDGRVLHDIAERAHEPATATVAHLLPNWDEYTVAYRDRDDHVEGVAFDPALFSFGSVLASVVTVDGIVRGAWRRAAARSGARVEVSLLPKTSRAHRSAIIAAAARYGGFLGRPVEVTVA